MTGLVPVSSLLDYLGNLVDLPGLDDLKLGELRRMLDPDDEDRLVDMGLWRKVGQSWIDLILGPGLQYQFEFFRITFLFRK